MNAVQAVRLSGEPIVRPRTDHRTGAKLIGSLIRTRCARWMSVTPLGRMGTPEEIARTVLYLASDQSSFTTGIGLLIDGGCVAT